MRTRRPRPELTRTASLAAIAIVATALVLVDPVRGAGETVIRAAASAWRGVFDERPRAASAQRMVVLLSFPSLADRMAAGRATPSADDQRRWTAEAQASQRLFLARLRARGITIRPEHSFTRTVNGFSALLDARALAELERIPGVQGVYPVRTLYPAGVAAETLSRPEFRAGAGRRADVSLPGFDGAGVTVALLDTGVDHAHPYLHGRVLPGVDVVAGDDLAAAEPKPDEPVRLEAHGTRMAGLVAGAGGPAGIRGVAPAVQVLPIRVLGWERAADGSYAVLGRGDGLVAGFERAVDPDGDGDVEDAVPLALAPVVEPFAAFPDSVEARAAAGASRLGTLVVTAAGNDGAAGRGFGTVGAPGGAGAALTVGAADTRRDLLSADTVLRAGREKVFDGTARVLGAVPPAPSSLAVAGLLGPSLADPARPDTVYADGRVLADFFDAEGVSRVAGKAVLLPATGAVGASARNAAAAGAAAVLVSGTSLPAGALDLDEAAAVPVVAVPAAAGRAALEGIARGDDVSVSFDEVRPVANARFGRVATFSSGGLAFDGGVKPDLVAPGVGIATSDVGRNADGTPRFATATGTSTAAAIATGAAALVAQARPGLEAPELKSLLVGSARQLVRGGAPEPVGAQGAGLVDPAAATAAEIAVEPSTLAFGRAGGSGWSAVRTLTIRNLSTRRLEIGFGVARDDSGDTAVAFGADPARLTLQPGASQTVTVAASAQTGLARGAGGTLVVAPEGSRPVRVPWAVGLRSPDAERLLSSVHLSHRSFAPSSTAPAVIAFRAGRVATDGRGIEPVALLEAELRTAGGKRLGVLARLRDLLPGRYAFGLTGRDRAGNELPPGDYVVVLRAHPVPGDEGAPPSEARVAFTITR